jgi:hypothetical protein
MPFSTGRLGIDASTVVTMGAEEGRPGLPPEGRCRVPSGCISGWTLREKNPELEQLAPNALGSPEAVLGCLTLDQRDRLDGYPRQRRRLGSKSPKQPKPEAVPAQDRLGLDDRDKCRANSPAVGRRRAVGTGRHVSRGRRSRRRRPPVTKLEQQDHGRVLVANSAVLVDPIAITDLPKGEKLL